MAKIYLAHSHKDGELAKAIEQRLTQKGHSFTYSAGWITIGNWRKKLFEALRSADVVMPLISQNGLESSYLVSEVGAARVYDDLKGTLVIPIVVEGHFDIPAFISDYQYFHLKSVESNEIDELINIISDAIYQNIAEAPPRPKIFISHRHKDEEIAEALIELLECAFHIETVDIRCTSVQPYTLSSGERTSDRLRTEIAEAEVVIGLLTPDTKESNYVVAELGAAWGCDVPTYPLLARDASFDHVPEPLNERHSLSLQKESDCFQLIDDIARETSLKRKAEVSGRVMKEARDLVRIASEI